MRMASMTRTVLILLLLLLSLPIALRLPLTLRPEFGVLIPAVRLVVT